MRVGWRHREQLDHVPRGISDEPALLTPNAIGLAWRGTECTTALERGVQIVDLQGQVGCGVPGAGTVPQMDVIPVAEPKPCAPCEVRDPFHPDHPLVEVTARLKERVRHLHRCVLETDGTHVATVRETLPRGWGYDVGVNELTLIAPRGYCAGVDRAIETVERALQEYGAPIYVRGEIVHNKHVVADLARKGAVFVDQPEQVPHGAKIILSAHGSAPEVYERCRHRGLHVIDATCPLVSKVHAEVRRYAGRGATVLLVGHPEHDEVIGTRGEAPDRVIVVEDVAQAQLVQVPDPHNVALTTQTTLSLDDTAAIVAVLRHRFPALQAPASSDICYATQNRQDAVKAAVTDDRADLVLVVGSQNSSNSQRLVDVAVAGGADAYLIDSQADLQPQWLDGHTRVALTAGASAPEELVQGIADWLSDRGWLRGGEEIPSSEGVVFALPVGFQTPPSPRLLGGL